MKKKICVCLLLLILIFNLNISISYGHKTTGIAKELVRAETGPEYGGVEEDGYGNALAEAEMLENLKPFGYNGPIQDEIRWEAEIKFTVKATNYYNADYIANGKYWTIKIEDGIIYDDIDKKIDNVKFDDARKMFACEHHKPTDKEIKEKLSKAKNTNDYVEILSYKAVIIAKKDLSNKATSVTETGAVSSGLKYFLDSVYTGRDMEEGNKVQISDKNTEIAAESGKEKVQNPLDFLKELIGKLIMGIFDFFRAIPDALQMGINTFAKIDTIEAKTVNAEPEAITVPVETIQADSKKNERAQFTTGDENKGNPDKQIIYEVDGKDANFTEETEIPTIPLDMYNIVYGKIDFLDVNFFNVDTSKHQEGTKWMFLRKVFSGALHIMIYLSTAFLIVVLIINGIMIVKGTIIPEKKKEQIDGLKRFVLALIMLVGSVIIMNLCIYGINFFTSFFGDETGGDAFIRVNVAGDTNYSFSANLTEFARFMTQINTVKKLNEKLMYIAIYAFLVFANIVTLLIMLVRSAMIIILSAQGPIVATAYSIDKKVFNMSYSDWIKKYLKWTSIQFILMLGYKLIITLGNL